MKDIKYRIYMEEQEDLPEGWYCGGGVRQNPYFHRCDDEKDADTFDDRNVVLFVQNMNQYGYRCREVPYIPSSKKLELLGFS